MKKAKFAIIFIFMLIIFSATELYSHNKTIKGRVTTSNGKKEPVVGATVRISNSVLGAITNKDGYFAIKNVPDGTYEVVITSVGMKPINYKVVLEHIDGDEFELDLEMFEDPIRTKNITVTATRSEKIYDDVPIKVSVISDKVFEATSSISLREGLNFQPGLRTEINCQNCGYSQIRMNGLEGMYSQVLIDGRAVFSALNSVYGLDQIPVNMIDRIEVVRGGGSALYGGSAIAGVVNVITKLPSENKFNVGITQNFIDGYSPENSVSIAGSIINENQNLGLNIFGTSNFRKEFDNNDDSFSDIARLNVKTFGARGFYKMSFNNILNAEFHSIYHSTRGGNKFKSPAHQADIAEEISHNTLSGQVSYEQYLNKGLDKISLYASFQMTKRDSYYGTNQDPNAYGITDNETIASGLQYSKVINDLLGYHILTAGYEYTSDFVNDIALGYNRNIKQKSENNALYFQDDWTITDWLSLVLGARLDKNSFLENYIVSPRSNILFKLTDNLSLRTNISTGFRAPQSFDEDLHISVTGGERMIIVRDPNLKPEYSLSYGGALDYNFTLLSIPFAISVEYFNTKLDRVFYLEEEGNDNFGNNIFVKKNGDGAKVQGFTFESEIRPSSKLNFKLGWTFQQSLYDNPIIWAAGEMPDNSDAKSSNKMFRTPDSYGYLILDYQFINSMNVNISGVYTGSMYVPHFKGYINESKLERTDSFFDLSVKLNYTLPIKSNVDAFVGVKNILNQYQKDLDKGMNRDAAYIYGPAKPITYYMGFNIGV